MLRANVLDGLRSRIGVCSEPMKDKDIGGQSIASEFCRKGRHRQDVGQSVYGKRKVISCHDLCRPKM